MEKAIILKSKSCSPLFAGAVPPTAGATPREIWAVARSSRAEKGEVAELSNVPSY